MKRISAFLLVVAFVGSWAAPATALPDIPADKFQPSKACGCHSALMEEWAPSMHAKAITDPLYILKRDEADKATNGALGEFCDGCHAPIAVMGNERADSKMSPQSKEGVTCDFCHSVTGQTKPLGNTSLAVRADGVKRAQLKDAQSPVHETAFSSFHTTAEFCGSCHNVDHPGNPSLHLESTYTEWKNGPYGRDFIVCQDCHMTPGPLVTKPNPGVAAAGGPQRDHIYTMTFAGGNVGLGDSVLAEQRLKAAATLEIEGPEILAGGSKTDLKVTITNSGAGHYLPTGLTEVRQMWLEVTATDSDGKTVELGKHEFGSVLKDAKGKYPVELWEAVAFQKDDRIPPKESVTDSYSFTMPSGSNATSITATLYYRSCSEEMAKKAKVDIPTTTMASVSRVVYASDDARADAARTAIGGGSSDSGDSMVLYIALAGLVVAGAAVTIGAIKSKRTGS